MINEYPTHIDNKIENDTSWIVPIGIQKSGYIECENFKNISSILVAGATGFGKTSFVQSIISNLMVKNTPAELRLIVFDSKGVDYYYLNGSPFLLTPVLHDIKKLEGAINWAMMEAHNRIYNHNEKNSIPEIFIIIDDFYAVYEYCSKSLEDLMMINRRAGIHCFIVSSAFTRKTLSKELSNNIMNRVSFYLVDKSTSRFVLDDNGAEKLIEKGEMIYKKNGYYVKCKAIYTDEDTLEKNSRAEGFDNTVSSNGFDNVMVIKSLNDDNADHYDELFEDAARLVIEKEKASIGNLQRIFRIGFNQAARIMDQLAEAGVVGPEEGTKPRKILMTMEQFEEYLKALK